MGETREASILEIVGVELIGVITPVSICMFLVVLIVYALSQSNPLAVSSSIRTAANLVYLERPSDSPVEKLEGALLNAVVFVVLVAIVTLLLVILYYYNCTNFLKNYTRFSSFVVLGAMGGSLSLTLIQQFSIPVDAITFLILLFNFTAVGVISVFSGGVPIVIRQGYLVALGIIVATWFTKLPEWTTWFLLVALAIYDLVAVLAPRGPLKMLVELAQTRDEEIPALVYEARPTISDTAGSRGRSLEVLLAGVVEARVIEMQPLPTYDPDEDSTNLNTAAGALGTEIADRVITSHESPTASNEPSGHPTLGSSLEDEIVVEDEMSPLVEMRNLGDESHQIRRGTSESHVHSGGIKLGLGDFIFYSVLVGRAAMYDLMTVYACYLAIISGLGCTLILLSVCRKALPALPISISLGVIFYFLTRLLMEPFIVGISTKLIFF